MGHDGASKARRPRTEKEEGWLRELRRLEQESVQDLIINVGMTLTRQGLLVRTSRYSKQWQEFAYELAKSERFKNMPGRPEGLDRMFFDAESYPICGSFSESLTALGAFVVSSIGKYENERWFFEDKVGRWAKFQETPKEYQEFVAAAAEVAKEYIVDGKFTDFIPPEALKAAGAAARSPV